MPEVIAREVDRLTDRLGDMQEDIRYLEDSDPRLAVDTLDRVVANCAETLTRIKRLRRLVQTELWANLTEGIEVPF